MTYQRLSDEEEAKLVALFDAGLRVGDLQPPLHDETEPAYTARVLMPLAKEVLKRIHIEGVTLAGEGAARVVPTYLLGHRFYPDMAVSFFGNRLVAYEVKFLRVHSRPNSLSTSLGQCLLYQLDRYPRVRAVLIDRVGATPEDLEHCRLLFTRAGGKVDVIHRLVWPTSRAPEPK